MSFSLLGLFSTMLVLGVVGLSYVLYAVAAWKLEVAALVELERSKVMQEEAKKIFMRTTLLLLFVLAGFVCIHTLRQGLMYGPVQLEPLRFNRDCAMSTTSTGGVRYTELEPSLIGCAK